MAVPHSPVQMTSRSSSGDSRIRAVLGPTNTGKTHLAIERLCAHSSGAIGFPLRLLAREVYDRVRAIKGDDRVALITGEERIEPKDARWLLCTVEAMPVSSDLAFVALDEAQLGADRERGHIFTDRLLNLRGREETMILGSRTIEPLVKALVPEAEIIGRPRFSTLSHTGARKLSRIPPRSAIVAFSVEQVYVIAEMLRRFRGGAAVVMGALSPQTRNAQVALYQSGEVDYLVATDAIGMGLNLDINHVAFAGLSKFDGQRQRRLTPGEMAQIAGRAGRHQQDGTFGTLAGTGSHDAMFTDDEVFAIESHRFAPLARMFWREANPCFDNVETLIADLESPPPRAELAPAPEAIDLAVLKLLVAEPDIREQLSGAATVRRFWETCQLPDFRQHRADTHARFVARLWQDRRHGYLGADYVAARIAELDNPAGDIDTLQGRIAAIRSWAYIAQRPDWVLAREEMAARARAVEARLSDALHARLTERFVNRRTSVLMKKLSPDAGMLPVRLEGDEVLVDGEAIGCLSGFRFRVDPKARHDDHRLLLAAAERHLPRLLAERAALLAAAISAGETDLAIDGGAVMWGSHSLALLQPGRSPLCPQLRLDPALDRLPEATRTTMAMTLNTWLAQETAIMAPLARLDAASRDMKGGPELRALLIQLVEAGGMLAREGSGLERLDKAQRGLLARLGVTVGALDIFVPSMLKPRALDLWREMATTWGARASMPMAQMPPVVPARGPRPAGYRHLSGQFMRIDLAEKLLREAHARREAAHGHAIMLDPARAISMGLSAQGHAQLLRLGGFRPNQPKELGQDTFGPPAPLLWIWRPARRQTIARSHVRTARPGNVHASPFATLAELMA